MSEQPWRSVWSPFPFRCVSVSHDGRHIAVGMTNGQWRLYAAGDGIGRQLAERRDRGSNIQVRRDEDEVYVAPPRDVVLT